MPFYQTYVKRVKVTETKHTQKEMDEMYGVKGAKTWRDLDRIPFRITDRFKELIVFKLRFVGEATEFTCTYDRSWCQLTVFDPETKLKQRWEAIETVFNKRLVKECDERVMFALTLPADEIAFGNLLTLVLIGAHFWFENRGRDVRLVPFEVLKDILTLENE